MASKLITVGHGTLAAEAFSDLVHGAGLALVIDIRRFPGSRRHPHFTREPMGRWLPEAGVAYRWEERLGGRRHGHPESPNLGLRDPSFRAYADYMSTPPFAEALTDVLDEAGARPTAVMCAETLWWRCHRRLVADAATLLHAVEVDHLFPDGSRRPHGITEGATVADGVVVYPGQQPTLL